MPHYCIGEGLFVCLFVCLFEFTVVINKADVLEKAQEGAHWLERRTCVTKCIVVCASLNVTNKMQRHTIFFITVNVKLACCHR